MGKKKNLKRHFSKEYIWIQPHGKKKMGIVREIHIITMTVKFLTPKVSETSIGKDVEKKELIVCRGNITWPSLYRSCQGPCSTGS